MGNVPLVRKAVASGLGVGFIPRLLWASDTGAGTFGAALALAISASLMPTPWWVGLSAAVVAIATSLWTAAPFATDGDPNWVVIDEVAGTLVALIGLTGWPWLVAFVVSRVADIGKWPPPVSAAERLPGALGVTTDDVVAGLYGLGAGWLMQALLSL